MYVHILHSDNAFDMQLTKDSMVTNICSCQLYKVICYRSQRASFYPDNYFCYDIRIT